MHVSDLHANFDPAEDRYGRIRKYFDQVRTANPWAIFTNAGDDHEKGSLAEVRSSGLATTEATVAMQFDVRTLGNHEFAWGEAHALLHSHDPHALVVLSNTTYTGSNPLGAGWVDFGVLEAGCLKVGFLGLVSPPWDETDNPVYIDYFPTFSTRYDYSDVVQEIVTARRSEVDVLVLVSHLGVIGDRIVAQNVTGVDLIIGGHTHGGPSDETVGTTRIIQPDFNGSGVTRIDVDVNLSPRQITGMLRTETPLSALVDTDATIHALVADIVASDAPEAHVPVGYLQAAASSSRILEIAGDAGRAVFAADAALVSPAVVNVFRPWAAGELTPQKILDFYWIERQPPNTPGISAQYVVQASGATLSAMRAAQPSWTYRGPDPPVPGQTYKVIVNKGAALQPAFYGFPGYLSVAFGAETWEVIRDYGALRTSQCKYLDSESVIPPCRATTSNTTWTFQNVATPLVADSGPAVLGYFDPLAANWATGKVTFATASAFGIASPRAGNPRIMSVAQLSPTEGLKVTHGEAPNGSYAGTGLVSEYTIVIDAFWPLASDDTWRSLLQTNPANGDDGDWFVYEAPSGGMGTSGEYFGSLPPNTWHRIAVVATVAPSGGTLKYYIGGAHVGTVTNAGQRWALDSLFLLFADNSSETRHLYVGGIRFAGYAMPAADIATLGGPQVPLGIAVNGRPPGFNGDARSDVLWRNASTGQVYQWQMNGLALSGQGYMPSVATNWAVAGARDVNGDGNADVFWRESGGLNYLWIVSGLGITAQGYLPSVPNSWSVAGLGDANGDGKADVFWRNPATGQNYLWVMNGLAIASQGFLPSVAGPDWEVAGVADYSGDGKADALWRNKATGQNYLWVMNGAAIASQGFLPSVASSDWEVVGSPDANGDGKADVLWRHKTIGQNYLWIMNGLAVASQGFMPSVADANWKVVGYGDYNGDGRGDVLWRHETSGQNYLWILNGLTVSSQGYLPAVSGANWKPVK